jgi:hypothetical protein
MRACAILAITNIQFGQMRLFHQNLARYHAIVAMDGLHDEANWPKDIGIVEIEERRRLVSYMPFTILAAFSWAGLIQLTSTLFSYLVQATALHPTNSCLLSLHSC